MQIRFASIKRLLMGQIYNYFFDISAVFGKNGWNAH
jgi:hypothetical protein